MKKIVLLSILLLLAVNRVQAQDEAVRVLEAVERGYSGLKDYTADVKVHFDTEALKAPDMQAKLYYKAPDKLKVESKRVFFLPREAGFFNPAMFRPEDFDIIFLEHLTYNGSKAVRLKLIPKKIRRMNQEFVLTIDTDHRLIREINISQPPGNLIKAVITYDQSGGFEVPTRIELQLDIPPAESGETGEFAPFSPRGKRITGKVEITYSNYRVNSGLSDEMFKETGPGKRK